MDQVAEEAQQSNTFDELHDIAEEFNEECSSPGLLPEDSFLGEFSASEDEEDRESLWEYIYCGSLYENTSAAGVSMRINLLMDSLCPQWEDICSWSLY